VRVARRRAWFYGAIIGLVVAAVVVAIVATRDDDSAVEDSRTIRVPSMGISVTVPNGWRQFQRPPANFPTTPELSVFTDTFYIQDDDCRTEDHTTVTVHIVRAEDASLHPSVKVIPRPDHFDATQGIVQTGEQFADIACDEQLQTIAFSDRGGTFVAFLGFGSDSPSARRSQAYRILDSMQIE
jgi:hypothetical protein